MIGLISCSSGRDYYYFNEQYSAKKYNDVSLGIIMMDGGLDTTWNIDTLSYNIFKTFKKQLPIGITYFSKFSKVEWISYYYQLMVETVQYSLKTENDDKKFFSLPYSMEQLQKEHKYDFLMFIHSLAITPIVNYYSKEKGNPKKYQTALTAKYIIWDNKTLDLITMNKVDIIREFDFLASQRSYKNFMMKLAAIIVDDLPMFKK